MTREDQIRRLESDLSEAVKVVETFNEIINAYVLDYYTESHWERLPKPWRDCKLEMLVLADILDFEKVDHVKHKHVLPLSLLALRKCLQKINVPRRVPEAAKNQKSPLKHLYKQVKEKKCHEINRMAALTASTARQCNVKYIIDFGAGLGHLARILAFQHGLRVCCLEQQAKLSSEAKVLDERSVKIHRKLQGKDAELVQIPVHLNFTLSSETNFEELLKLIRDAFGIPDTDKDARFGLIGLHPCGDLAIILTRFFMECKEVNFLNIVGCCYMKLTTPSTPRSMKSCHPMSSFLKRIHPQGLSYEAREIACHAIESYTGRLKTNNYEYLKIHCYRALIERIICRHDPSMKHCGLKSVKQKDGLSFEEYARIVTNGLKGLEIREEEFVGQDIEKNLSEWRNVVIFYSFRLLLAPLIETILLYDRMLWILEMNENVECNLRETFDPQKSPRNHVLIAQKK